MQEALQRRQRKKRATTKEMIKISKEFRAQELTMSHFRELKRQIDAKVRARIQLGAKNAR